MARKVVMTIVLLFSCWTLQAQSDVKPLFGSFDFRDTKNFLFLDLVGGIPFSKSLYQEIFFGGRFEFDLKPGPWGVELELDYHSKAYFFYNSATKTWYGPVSWGLGPQASSQPGDYPFYLTRYILAPGLVYKWFFTDWELKAAAGLLFQFSVLPESADYYPDFKNQYQNSEKKLSSFLGSYFKVGADFEAIPYWTWGTDLVFEVSSWNPATWQTGDRFWPDLISRFHFDLRTGLRL